VFEFLNMYVLLSVSHGEIQTFVSLNIVNYSVDNFSEQLCVIKLKFEPVDFELFNFV